MKKIAQKNYHLRFEASDTYKNSLTQAMAEKIVDDFSHDCEYLIPDGITLTRIQMREYDLMGGEEPSWSASLLLDEEDSLAGEVITFETQQFYRAFHKLNDELNYSGEFTVELTFRKDGQVEESIVSVAKISCSLMHSHYRERIYEYFPDWETDYVDKVIFYRIPDND